MDTTYNGWRNRETWCVGLHLMDTVVDWIYEDIDEWAKTDEDTDNAANLFKDLVEEAVSDADLPSHTMLWDLLDLSLIDYRELGKSAIDSAFETER